MDQWRLDNQEVMEDINAIQSSNATTTTTDSVLIYQGVVSLICMEDMQRADYIVTVLVQSNEVSTSIYLFVYLL